MSLLLLNLVYVNQADFHQLASFTFNFSHLLSFGVARSTFTDGGPDQTRRFGLWLQVNNHRLKNSLSNRSVGGNESLQLQTIGRPSFTKTHLISLN